MFVAVNWGAIPDTLKLGVLLLATGGFLIAGRSLKATLPATAGALFHLGTFLVPINVAAIGVHAELDWATLLLAEGLIATATFGWAARTERSVVLRSAFAVAVVALAGGIGATTPLPAPLVLAGSSPPPRSGSGSTRWRSVGRPSPAWRRCSPSSTTSPTTAPAPSSGSASPAPSPVWRPCSPDSPPRPCSASPVAAATTPGLVLLGVALGAVGAVASWTGQEPDGSTTLIGLASVFLLGRAGGLRHP